MALSFAEVADQERGEREGRVIGHRHHTVPLLWCGVLNVLPSACSRVVDEKIDAAMLGGERSIGSRP